MVPFEICTSSTLLLLLGQTETPLHRTGLKGSVVRYSILTVPSIARLNGDDRHWYNTQCYLDLILSEIE
jgi:hypothetical protein